MSTIGWWDASSELAQTHRMMDRLFDSFFGPGGAGEPGSASRQTAYTLPVDILETEDAYVLEAAVPGFPPEKVQVTFDQGILGIEAQAEPATVNGRWLRRERPRGSFLRRLQLPSEVQGDRIAATFADGILTVTVPKSPRPQPLKIPVSGAEEARLAPSRS